MLVRAVALQQLQALALALALAACSSGASCPGTDHMRSPDEVAALSQQVGC
jgi:hypothetical protein